MPSSSTTVSHEYDVFMSFRGEDTRTGFISHLYDALTRNDIRTYKDDKSLEVGNPIASKLVHAIETSRTAIVVLSSSFATSKWCLEEIAKIVDCMKRGKLIVVPIFYHVSPSDVRHQSNCFEQGFASHEEDLEITPHKVEIWRAAFREVGAILGWHVTRDREEAEVVSKIVSKISRDLPDTFPEDLPNSLVGIQSRVDEVKSILRLDSGEVLFVGICGMSGIGKTTLAEVVHKEIKNKFERSSFIENIKDISKQNDSTDLCKLQQKLFDDILKEKSIRVQSVKHGQTLLGTKLSGLKVLIVLDDVNHVAQLTYLAGGREWFGPGTRIIVTTTNTDLLNPHNINEIYLYEEMKGNEALSLFCKSVFQQNHPAHGYEKLSYDIVKLADGLPLALNAYGSLLCGKGENYWKEMLKKLQEYPDKEVLGRLEVVYVRLDRDQRDAFIYIACFLKGRNKDLVKDILTSIGLYSECGFTDLMNKFLITINIEDSVWMHDLLQQMCWEILHKESQDHDGKHIAIKLHEDIVDILSSKQKVPYLASYHDQGLVFSSNSGTQAVEVINQEPYKGEVSDTFVDPTCFSKMKKLKFLRISNVHFPQGLNYLSNELRILECFSKNLTKIPDLTSASNLVKLNLEGCKKLTTLHDSVLHQKRIRYLNLKGCTCLESLGRSHMEMEALEALLLSGCSKLESIPEFGKNMKCLEILYVDGTRIKKLPENLGEMCDLRKLDASGTFIEELPYSIYGLKKLRLLRVNRCRLSFKTGCFFNPSLYTLSSDLKEVDLSCFNLSVVPDGIGLLCRLITLDLSGNEFVSLPANDDTDYGPRSRFSYYVSTEGVDVSKFHASSFNGCPTVSCLNCPKLAVSIRGHYLAEKILNSYLQLRMNYWMTPEAVFEIVDAGGEIPYGFLEPGTGGLVMEGPWIGVAICAVISVHHVDVYMESKYTLTAHINFGGKHWKIPVPINFLVAGSETQLVFYWTVADDLLRIVGSSQKSNFGVSFSVEPQDDNIHVTKFGVRFIDNEFIMRLKQYEGSSISVVKRWCTDISGPNEHKWYIAACNDDTNLHHHTLKIADLVDFIFDYGRQQDSLDGIYKITKGLLEINQEFFRVLNGCKRKWNDTMCVHSYYVMSLGASVLYNDFVQSLEDIKDGWLSVKLALEQIVVKSRAGHYTSEGRTLVRASSSHLYDALTRNDIRTYKDDKSLEVGNPIASELLQAIETSRIAVVVLSSNFATSKWCLEEIAKIVDCMKRGKLIVVPIYYHVSPSEVRHQSNCFEQGFACHEVDPEIAPHKVEIWRAAFREVGAISGWHVTRDREEAEVVSKTVSKILKDLPDTVAVHLPHSLVGIESRVDDVNRILRLDSSEVLFVGICGMSGIGKTTLAEAVYKDIKNKFERSSFIENIKDISKQNDSSDLCKLQQKLLDDLLKEKSIRVQSVKHGQSLLGTKLSGLKVIIVLDDVNHVDQLAYLAGVREWFGPGTRILVTTTNKDLLNPHKINEIYLCEELKGDEALSLFCQSAFQHNHPAHGYEKLSNDIVKLADGLPLALNVYGSLLCGKDENYWKDMLKKLGEYPDKEVLGRLEVVYARLDRDQRDAFIYIACFLKGRNKDLVKGILTSIGLYPECGFTDLMNKFLITINIEDNVWMHDLLQQMCWEILRKESHDYDGKRIAIKYHEDIVRYTLIQTRVEVINQEPYKGEVNDCVNDPTCFSKMKKLKFLRISDIHFPQGLNYLSNDLRILEWYRCSLKSLPSMFAPKHIYELDMCSSQLNSLWEKNLELPNLQSINLSFSTNLTKIPDLTSASNLVKLNLEGCTKLARLHESVLLQKRLRYLNLKGCTCLESLGRSHMEMEALEALLLSGCSKLESIPEFGKNMKRLEHLYVDGTRIKKLPENLGEMCDLRKLDASGTFIEELPSSIYGLKKLRLLHANRCRLSFKTGCCFKHESGYNIIRFKRS
ncbi:hypothetical protein SSX86_001854 [Deinandra increscens subsp. villosa]|uniref:TIR domain-containing protein n=1 Tax=Deinandra increscens subsp. villosa TaxID=3103831 RepID=A0AAP0DSG0_9ASTR